MQPRSQPVDQDLPGRDGCGRGRQGVDYPFGHPAECAQSLVGLDHQAHRLDLFRGELRVAGHPVDDTLDDPLFTIGPIIQWTILALAEGAVAAHPAGMQTSVCRLDREGSGHSLGRI